MSKVHTEVVRGYDFN
jgi:deoxyhypusine synthase